MRLRGGGAAASDGPAAGDFDPVAERRATALRRHGRARGGMKAVFVAVAATTFLLSLQIAPAAACVAALGAALLAESAERLALGVMARWPARRRGRPWALRLAAALGIMNTLVLAGCLAALAEAGGPAAAPLVAAAALSLSASMALVHLEMPRLNLMRQAAMLAVVLASWAQEAAADVPGARLTLAAIVMLAAILAIIYAHLHSQAERRRRIQAELFRARREAERRSETLERVRDAAERESLHDPLTGLPNRRYLEQTLARLECRGELPPPEARHLAVLVVDLDRFKAINDTLGHDAGDHVLRRMADVMRDSVREGDFVARTGGDEFVILAPCGRARSVAEGIARRLIERAREPVDYRGHACRLGATVGIAMGPRLGLDARRLIAQADIALYRAKRLGRGRAEFFSQKLQRAMAAERRLADDIFRGLEAGEFAPFYQPQLRAGDLSVFGLEAVARWRHPHRGVLPPGAFLTAASEAGALAEIDRMILHRVLVDREALAARGTPPPRMSVNAGVARLTDPKLAAELARAGLPPGALAMELSDVQDLTKDEEALRWAMERLAGLGVDVDLAGFGCGPATVGTLARLRPRRLKLDRRLGCAAADAPERRRMLRAVVELADALGVGVIAEGVETPEQMRMMREIGCEALQGFAIAAPMCLDGVERWLEARGAGAVDPGGADVYMPRLAVNVT